MEKLCRNCRSPELKKVLDLGLMPLANNLLSSPEEKEERYPLEVVFCENCTLLQITVTVPPEKLFRQYVYLSSYSDTVLKNAKELSEKIIEKLNLTSENLVVEIGSNDGYLLQFFVEKGIPVLGVEPALNIAKIANEKGIRTIPEFFSLPLAEKLARERKADVIIANNVLAHVADSDGLIRGIAHLLSDDGVFVGEVPYVKDMIEKNEFDTIYHEHLCYFSVTSISDMFERRGLEIFDVEWIPIHGGSLRVWAGKPGKHKKTERLKEFLRLEKQNGVTSFGFYSDFADRVSKIKRELLEIFRRIKGEGKRIAGYGAAAKATVMLNYLGVGPETVEFVADRNPVKQGKFVPGVKIPIVPPEKLVESMPDYTIIFVWNIADEVISQQKKYLEKGGRFIVPIPYPKIVE